MTVFASDDVAVGIKRNGISEGLVLRDLADGDEKGVYFQLFGGVVDRIPELIAARIFKLAAGHIFGRQAIIACACGIALCIIICSAAAIGIAIFLGRLATALPAGA